MNVPGKIMIMMSKDKSQVFILRMSSTFRDININVQEDQGKEDSDESDATDLEAGVGDVSSFISNQMILLNCRKQMIWTAI